MSHQESTPDSELWQLIYASGATVRFSEADVKSLVAAAQSRNRAVGITGLLIYYQGSFLQILEGPLAAVERLFEKIQLDRRHARILLLERRPIPRRDFPTWDLELFEFTADQAVQAELGHTQPGGVCASDLSAVGETNVPVCIPDHCLSPRLQSLLKQFRAGQWRRAFDCRRGEKIVAPICWGAGEMGAGSTCFLAAHESTALPSMIIGHSDEPARGPAISE